MKLNAASEQYFTRWEGKATLPRPPKTRLPWRPWPHLRSRVPIVTKREGPLGRYEYLIEGPEAHFLMTRSFKKMSVRISRGEGGS